MKKVVAIAVVVVIIISTGAGYLVGVANKPVSTTTVPEQYSITFLGTPSGCSIQAFCINATLVNHLGSNISVIAQAWLRNTTTGQNVTVTGGGKNSIAYASCTADARGPTSCYIIANVSGGTTFEVTLTILGLDGRTVLSPTVTANVTD